jgi:glycosyltransferase involved in cell wall biosynthesis
LAENGVDEQQFFPDPVQSFVALKAGKKAVLLLSRSDKRKGFDLGIEVIKRVAASNPDFVVWSVGEKAMGVFGGVPHHDFGYVGGDELRRIMSSADILLYPSRHEGFPLMILEAFACKLPVVTTKAVSFACHRENALVAGLEDTDVLSGMLLELLNDDMLADQLATAAAQFAADHSIKKATAVFESHVLKRAEWCWAGHS